MVAFQKGEMSVYIFSSLSLWPLSSLWYGLLYKLHLFLLEIN